MLSTWWIKNPFLKNKIIDVCLFFLNLFCFLTASQILFCSCFTHRGQPSLLGPLLNSHPVALKYLMPALTHFYIGMPTLLRQLIVYGLRLDPEVEQTGASSQFYDKFSTSVNSKQ